MRNKFFLPAILLVASLLLIAAVEVFQHAKGKDNVSIAATAQKNLQQLEERMQQSLNLISTFKNEKDYHEYFVHRNIQQHGFSFYSVEGNRINRWSDNEPALNESQISSLKNQSLVKLRNGWFESFVKEEGEKKTIGLLLIKKEYAYENKYLINDFNLQLGLPSTTQLADDETKNSFSIKSVSGENLFRFIIPADEKSEIKFDLFAWLWLLAFVFFLIALFFIGRNLNAIPIILLCVGIVLLRIAMIHFHIPDELYSTAFFGQQNYASGIYFNSFGDLFLNAITFLFIATLVYSAITKKYFSKQSSFLFKGIAAIISCLLLWALHLLVCRLLLHTKISLDASNIFGMGVYSFLFMFVISLLLASWFIFSFGLIRAAFGVPKKISVNFILCIVLVISYYTSWLIYEYNDLKERAVREQLAQRVDARQDNVAEYLFGDIERKISSDTTIKNILADKKQVNEELNKHLLKNYFSNYWNKFEINVFAFQSDSSAFDTSNNSATLESFQQSIIAQGKPASSDKFFYLNSESGRLSYIAVLPIATTDSSIQQPRTANTELRTLVLTFDAKFFQNTEGFPELFVSNRANENKQQSNYSFARYSEGALIYEYGNYAYSFSSTQFATTKNHNAFITLDGFSHFVYHASPTAIIVVSKPKESSIVPLTLFSYVFSFFSVLILLSWFFYWLFHRSVKIQFTLKSRIQVSVITLVALSFILIGSGTVYYIKGKYSKDEEKNISERINGLWFILSNNLSFIHPLTKNYGDELLTNLYQLTGNLNVDFNIYDETGNLFYSSQPKIFEQGIVSQRMNPEALFEVNENSKTQFIVPENIGRLNYIAGYAPFTTIDGQIAGYLNLPYFEKQNELNKEISSFLSALINIYVLLFALAVLITLFISSRITKPLLLIREKLSNLSLEGSNETIEWKHKDEIGELVNQYNSMVNQLAKSADQLARSERESAWREMAKQVAHEIKNPLTPMKLSVQHLQRAWKDKNENIDELFTRISQTLIEQMDTLSNIAAEFSNFAQMPHARNEILNLTEIISSSINLFKETPNIDFHFEDDKTERNISADKEQLIRVFSNLLKNAVQSIPEERKGVITLKIKSENGFYFISITDNGKGISEEEQQKIFTPNFTTKSSGMGLGLAMAKNILENAGGKIWFETKENTGTTFFVIIPRKN